MVHYLCRLQIWHMRWRQERRIKRERQTNPEYSEQPINNLITVKIHGGIQERELLRIVERAEKLADENALKARQHHEMDEARRVKTGSARQANAASAEFVVPYTVLFLDETNSSEIIHLIKELLCDRRLKSKTISPNLKIVCACNPYRKHSAPVIDKQKQAGLGYFKGDSETCDLFGRIPMRQLVYRVQPLPKKLAFVCVGLRTAEF